MIKIFERHKIHVKPTVVEDLASVAARIRKADKDEIWASHLIEPLPALAMGLKCSVFCDTVFRDELPIAVYGVVPNPMKLGTACIWMLGTNELDQVPHAFGKMTHTIIQDIWETYPVLYNYVDVRNKKSIGWLKSCGAQFQDPAPYGVAKMPFVYFQIRKAA